jgi:hypothetical protein
MTPPAKRAQAPRLSVPRVKGERITTDDLRHKALAIRDVATDEARHVLERNTVRIVVVSAVVVAVALSAAYYIGSRSAARAARRMR